MASTTHDSFAECRFAVEMCMCDFFSSLYVQHMHNKLCILVQKVKNLCTSAQLYNIVHYVSIVHSMDVHYDQQY